MVLQDYRDGENDSKGSVLIENDGGNLDINRAGPGGRRRRAKNPPNVGHIGCAVYPWIGWSKAIYSATYLPRCHKPKST